VTLHPFALRFPLSEIQSYYWMVVQYSPIFPWDKRNPLFTFFTSSYNDHLESRQSIGWWRRRHLDALASSYYISAHFLISLCEMIFKWHWWAE